MTKVILISQFPLPYHKIGSWTNMYKKYLESDHLIDYVICEQPKEVLKNVNYNFVKRDFLTKIRSKLSKFYRLDYIDALEKIIKNKEHKYIIHVIDNYKMVFKINELLHKKGLRNQCYIQAFYHGFSPFLGMVNTRNFYEIIDELTLLTHDSYKAHLKYYNIFPCKVSVLYNGIDTLKFKRLIAIEKDKLKKQFGYSDKKVFLWCSQDRPKKGLKLILDVWKRVYLKNKDIVLIVVGTQKKSIIEGVEFMGKIPNDEIAKFYQMADCYLFPTLCHEGFGLSLIEALNCGCYCIASNNGGVPEVLQYGKYGKIIENPNFSEEWEIAINNYITGKEQPITISQELYTIEDWIVNMNKIIQQAKISLS